MTSLQKARKETRASHTYPLIWWSAPSTPQKTGDRKSMPYAWCSQRKLWKTPQVSGLSLGPVWNYTAFNRGLEMLCVSPTRANCTVQQALMIVKLLWWAIPGFTNKEGILDYLNVHKRCYNYFEAAKKNYSYMQTVCMTVQLFYQFPVWLNA